MRRTVFCVYPYFCSFHFFPWCSKMIHHFLCLKENSFAFWRVDVLASNSLVFFYLVMFSLPLPIYWRVNFPDIKFDNDNYFSLLIWKCCGISFWPPWFPRNPLSFKVVFPVANVLVSSDCFQVLFSIFLVFESLCLSMDFFFSLYYFNFSQLLYL